MPLLTLREIWVRVVDLPPTSAIAVHENGGTPRWGIAEYLLADIWGALTGQAHAARPKSAAQRAMTATRRRAKKRVEARFARRNRVIGTDTE
ncbi:hypothetical protein [Nocardia sp. NPDC058633]|uniref:hypothetical protein n=1 Tax=Nocardia sp. NPDC058633 TaxID=3346568 RepID=UPI003667BF4F